MKYVYKYIDTPIGQLKLIASAKGLAAVLWPNDKPTRVKLPEAEENIADEILGMAERQLAEYFAGVRKEFSVPLDMHGTDFQQSVWKALLTIPFGQTKSYSELARQILKPSASRAVGMANGRNPLSILVPCHRVIGTNGKLTGFAGGLDVKARLLELEK